MRKYFQFLSEEAPRLFMVLSDAFPPSPPEVSMAGPEANLEGERSMLRHLEWLFRLEYRTLHEGVLFRLARRGVVFENGCKARATQDSIEGTNPNGVSSFFAPMNIMGVECLMEWLDWWDAPNTEMTEPLPSDSSHAA